jgi:hypothetical protein
MMRSKARAWVPDRSREYILQLARAAITYRRPGGAQERRIFRLFEEKHHRPRTTEIRTSARRARCWVDSVGRFDFRREFIIAETGSVLIATNEGNGRTPRPARTRPSPASRSS